MTFLAPWLADPTKREWLAEPYVRMEIITPEVDFSHAV